MNEPINRIELAVAARRRRQQTRIWCIVGLIFLISIVVIMDLMRLISGLFAIVVIMLILCLASFLLGRVWEAKKIYG